MDVQPWQWWLTTGLAGIGALGVVVGAWWRWTHRPTNLVMFQFGGANPQQRGQFAHLADFHPGDGDYKARVVNLGNVDVGAVRVRIVGGSMHAVPRNAPPWFLRPGEDAQTTFRGNLETSWVVITWTFAGSRTGQRSAAWWPVDSASALQAERERQIRRNLMQRWVVRRLVGHAPSPWTNAAGHVTLLHLGRTRSSRASTGELTRWRRRVLSWCRVHRLGPDQASQG